MRRLDKAVYNWERAGGTGNQMLPGCAGIARRHVRKGAWRSAKVGRNCVYPSFSTSDRLIRVTSAAGYLRHRAGVTGHVPLLGGTFGDRQFGG